MSELLLEMSGISKYFPGVQALKDVNLDIRAGEVHALLGENGAGKSTLIKILAGIYSLDEGEISICGNDVTIKNVHDSQAYGVSVIHQELVLVPEMTIAENIFLGREPRKGLIVDRFVLNKKTEELLQTFDLDFDPDTLVGTLTISQQQMVEITKALSFNSKILVMDEPTSSLSDKEVNFLFDTIHKLKNKGVGIVYVSHRMSELKIISDRVTVLRDGQYIGTVDTQDTSNDKLISMMVGRNLTSYYTRTYSSTDETVLEVQDLNDGKYLKNISFSLMKGEILGFSGLIGAGRSEVMRCIFGIDKYSEGKILINGNLVSINNSEDAMNYGIAYVPENRKKEALFPDQSVRFNITLKVLRKFIKWIFVNNEREKGITSKFVELMSIKTPTSSQLIKNLSGGNQQKVVISRWLATEPRILILDEPTRGVDVGAKAEIYSIMNELASKGVSIIMVSSELPEVINMSDRVNVMCNGRIVKCLDRNDLSQEKIMHYATSHE